MESTNDNYVIVQANNKHLTSNISDSGAKIAAMGSAYKELEDKLYNVFLALHKLGASTTSWGAAKNCARASEAAEDIKSQVPLLRPVFANSLVDSRRAAQEVAMLQQQLAERENQNDRLRYQNGQLSEKVDKLSSGLSSHKDVQQVLLDMQEKNQTLGVTSEQLQKDAAESTTKLKEIHLKLKQDIEARDCEIRRLQSEVRKFSRQDSAKSVRDQSAQQLASRTAEIKMLQRRFEATRSDLEHAKAAQQNMKSSLEEVRAQVAETHAENKLNAEKLAVTQKQKEALQQELKRLKGPDAEMPSSPGQKFRTAEIPISPGRQVRTAAIPGSPGQKVGTPEYPSSPGQKSRIPSMH
eukprot:gene1684-33080_t